ncbi:MAG: hypothetical protein KA202_04700 [Enterocloster sp.]|jgi:hypothetical protein|uniref:hypothetical protein n=1 Tax=Enterocloster clostridioformis TaxID=1531 RepID=UPI00070C49E3|nr:hypothetical protein [Enterocloster clostridioformis]MBP6561221.1 hypothetical protein [Enterocloster sp.]MCI7608777.1 hypothetical protein [Enterocloster clostridioformis]MDB2126226.1 hypothetical protein [Enterocloster clostridioformis]MDU1961819.1 hypothetical protein [Enterocloster clostridioformis]
MRQTVSLQSRYRKRSFFAYFDSSILFLFCGGKILKEKGMRVNVQNTCPNDIIRALKTRKHESGGCATGIKIQEGKK